MSSKIDNIYMYMPIILKSMSLYAISSQPLWFTVLLVILSVFVLLFLCSTKLSIFVAIKPPPLIYTHRHTCIQPSHVPLHTHTHLHPTLAQQTLNTQTTLREIIRCVVQGH